MEINKDDESIAYMRNSLVKKVDKIVEGDEEGLNSISDE